MMGDFFDERGILFSDTSSLLVSHRPCGLPRDGFSFGVGSLYHTPYSPAIAFQLLSTLHIQVHDGAQRVFQGHGIGHGEQSADGRFRFIVDAAGECNEQVTECGGRGAL